MRKIETQLNSDFAQSKNSFKQFQKELASFAVLVKRRKDLCQTEKGIGVVGIGRDISTLLKADGIGNWQRYGKLPQVAVIRWESPVEISALRITWGSRKYFSTWYGVEWFDGATFHPLAEDFHPLAEDRNNQFEVSSHQFKPIKTRRLRLIDFEFDGRSNVTLARNLEAFGTEVILEGEER